MSCQLVPIRYSARPPLKSYISAVLIKCSLLASIHYVRQYSILNTWILVANSLVSDCGHIYFPLGGGGVVMVGSKQKIITLQIIVNTHSRISQNERQEGKTGEKKKTFSAPFAPNTHLFWWTYVFLRKNVSLLRSAGDRGVSRQFLFIQTGERMVG